MNRLVRASFYIACVALNSASAWAQTAPTKEYVRLGGRVIAVENPAAPPVTVTLNPPQASVPVEGASGSFTVTAPAGVAWTATSQDPSWLTLSGGPVTVNGSGTGPVNWTAAGHQGDSRNGKVVVTGNFTTVEFTVAQSGSSAGFQFVAFPLTLPATASGTPYPTATITSNLPATPWTVTASSSENWLHVVGPGTGNGSGTVQFTYDANSNPQSRLGTLTLTSPGLNSHTLTFTQAPFTGGGAHWITTSSLFPGTTLHSRANDFFVTVLTNAASWNASSDRFWLSIQNGSGVSGNQFTFVLEPNNGNDVRSGTITIQAGTATPKTISVVQDKAGSLVIGPDDPWPGPLQSVDLLFGSSFQFFPIIDGITDINAPVTWNRTPAEGWITNSGLFTAPSSGPVPPIDIVATFTGTNPPLEWHVTANIISQPVAPPVPISVTPSNETGIGDSFATVVQDNNAGGASRIEKLYLNLDRPATNLGDCLVTLYPKNSPPLLQLGYDNGGLAGQNPVGSGSPVVALNGCTLHTANSDQEVNSNTLTLTSPMTFTAQSALGPRALVVRAESQPDGSGWAPFSPWVQLGTYTVVEGPTMSLISPTSGIGPSATFTADYSVPIGQSTSSLSYIDLLVGGATANPATACLVRYRPNLNQLFLLADNGTTEGTGYTPTSSGNPFNSRCSLSIGGSSATPQSNGRTLRLVLPITFKTAFSDVPLGAAKITYLRAVTTSGVDTTYQQNGSWTVDEYPTANSVSPLSWSGISGDFYFIAGDPNGAADIVDIYGLINTTPNPSTGCRVRHTAGQLTLNNATGSLTPGGTGFLDNGSCKLFAQESAFTLDNPTKTVTLKAHLEFAPSFVGSKNAYIYAKDNIGLEVQPGLVLNNSWIVVAPVDPPQITPGTGTYNGPLQVTITKPSGTQVHYTTNGNDPSCSTGIPYFEPFTINSAAIVKAIAFTTCGDASEIVQKDYTIRVPVHVVSNPPGRSLQVDGSNCTSPCQVFWLPGSAGHSIGVNGSPQLDALQTTRWVWSSWSDGLAQSHTISAAPSTETTYVANFATQYLLETTSNPPAGGQVLPAAGWHNGNEQVQLTAIPSQNYYFMNFTDAGGTLPSSTVLMEGPKSVIGHFSNVAFVTVQSDPLGREIFVDGQPCTVSPCTYQWTLGISHTLSVSALPQGDTNAGIQYVFTNWDGGSTSLSRQVTPPVAPSATYTAYFKTQFKLDTEADPVEGGTISPGDGWYDAGTSVTGFTATNNSGYVFIGFSGALSGTLNPHPDPVLMSQPRSVTANFALAGPAPNVVSLDPSDGSGLSGTFVATYNDEDGASDFKSLILQFTKGGGLANTCTVRHVRSTAQFSLLDDAGTVWLYPSGPTLQNARCILDVSASSASFPAGETNAVMTVNVTFKNSGWSDGVLSVLYATDLADQNSGWVQKGTWYISPAPVTMSVTPNLAYVKAGGTVQFTATTDPGGLPLTWTLTPQDNPPADIGTIDNGLYSAPGTVATPFWVIVTAEHVASGISVSRLVLVKTLEEEGAPTAVYIDPTSGTGNRETFTFAVSDPDDPANIEWIQAGMLPSTSGEGKCLVMYLEVPQQPGQWIALLDDGSGGWTAPTVFGSGGADRENSHCILHGATSAAQTQGNFMLLDVDIEFKAASSGTTKLQSLAVGNAVSVDWRIFGTWNIP